MLVAGQVRLNSNVGIFVTMNPGSRESAKGSETRRISLPLLLSYARSPQYITLDT